MNKNPFHSYDVEWEIPPAESGHAPLFIFAATWRSGSTLLQRLLCSDKSVIMWGEPFTDTDVLPRLAQSAEALLQEGWPIEAHFLPNREVAQNMSKYWIANIYPPPHSFREACRSMLDTLFMKPAQELGFTRFGFKEVRHTVEVPRFLQWLYPDARFIFLVRNPWDCWASYRGSSWYRRYPDQVVERVNEFAEIWSENLASFLKWHDESGLLIRYEDLVHKDFSVQRLALHCRLSNISDAPLKRKVRGLKSAPTDPIPEENYVLNEICGPMAKQFGYFGFGDNRSF